MSESVEIFGNLFTENQLNNSTIKGQFIVTYR